MKRFIIERKLPGAGKLTTDELRALSRTSNSAIKVLDKPYSWIESYVTEDKIYCIHEAEDEDTIREHSACGDLAIDTIFEIKAVIGPATGK